VGSFAVREKIAKALGTSLEEMISLGRRLQLGEGGERRSGQGRRASDLAAPQLIRLCAWLKSIPSAYRYLEMAELATTEGDLKLVLNLLKSAIIKWTRSWLMVNSQVIQLIARALEADTELPFRLIWRGVSFHLGVSPSDAAKSATGTCEEERWRTLSKYFGITWGSLRRKGCVTATNKAVLQGVFGFRAEEIFNNPDLIAHDPLEGDLLEVLFNAFDGRRFNFLCRIVAVITWSKKLPANGATRSSADVYYPARCAAGGQRHRKAYR